MKPENSLFEYGGLARFLDLGIDLFGDLFHSFLDSRGMDSAVGDQSFQRQLRNLSSDGIETRKNDHFGTATWNLQTVW